MTRTFGESAKKGKVQEMSLDHVPVSDGSPEREREREEEEGE